MNDAVTSVMSNRRTWQTAGCHPTKHEKHSQQYAIKAVRRDMKLNLTKRAAKEEGWES